MKKELSVTADLHAAITASDDARHQATCAMRKRQHTAAVVETCYKKFENQEDWRVEMAKDQVILSPRELWMQQAPSFNFELDQEQLVKHALEVGFVTKLNDNTELLVVNPHYGE